MAVKIKGFSIYCDQCKSEDVKIEIKKSTASFNSGVIKMYVRCNNCNNTIQEAVGIVA